MFKREPLDELEFQSAILVRNLETLRRRGEFYVEVDPSGYLLLRTIALLAPVDINTIAKRLGLDASTATRQVSAVHRSGLVHRDVDPDDRRRTLLSLTTAGHEAMLAVYERRRRGTAEMLDDWAQADVSAIGALMARYNEAISAQYITPRQEERRQE